MTALTTLFPRKSSRTSTHAIRVPITASIAATISDAISVSFIAATACGDVTSSQNAARPRSSERTTTADSGIRTISVSQATEKPPATSGPADTRLARVGRATTAGKLASGVHPQVLLDRGDRALIRVEELVVDLRPAAELVDLEELLGIRVRGLVHEVRQHRAVALGGVDLLRLGRDQPFQE